jgi:hypothetical protein
LANAIDQRLHIGWADLLVRTSGLSQCSGYQQQCRKHDQTNTHISLEMFVKVNDRWGMDGIVRENSNGTTGVRQTDSDRFQQEVMETSNRNPRLVLQAFCCKLCRNCWRNLEQKKITGKFTGTF